MTDTAEPDTSVEDLALGERLLLDALRAWATSRAIGCRPQAAVQRVLGWKTSRRSAALFCAWMQSLEEGVRRPITTYCRHCPGVASDERLLIEAVGLSAVDPSAGEALLLPLSADPAAALVIARALNAALRDEGVSVPARLGDMAPPAAHPAVLH